MIRRLAALFLVATAPLVASACTRREPPDPAPSRAWASSPSASAMLAKAHVEASPAAGAASADELVPAASASASASGSASSDAMAAIAFPSEAPPAKLRVYPVGLHIGGGPNDEATKEPILASITPYLDTMKRCWPLLDGKEQKRGGDFGVDLLVEAEGGRAKVGKPRGLKGEAFQTCLVRVFETIEFVRPKTGKTLASYSIHFAP